MKILSVLFACACLAPAQVPNPTQDRVPAQPAAGAPVYRVTVVARTTKAVNYRHRSGATKVDLHGTALMPDARGDAKVRSKQGRIEIDMEFDHLEPPTNYGNEYLTYVMWAITPEGRATNLGEVVLNNDKSELKVTTELQAFGLIMTAEPYFAVTQPSDVVVMENIIRRDTVGRVEDIDAKYELLPRGTYAYSATPATRVAVQGRDSRIPNELFQARNAVRIARAAQADTLATDSYNRAVQQLDQAEAYLARKAGKKPIAMIAREAAQTAEDARVIAFRRERELEQEQAKRQARQAEAEAAAEAQRRAQAESDQQAAEKAKAQAEEAKAQAEEARQQAERLRREAEEARSAALAQQQAAQAEAARARQQAAEADSDRNQLRNQLREQLNSVLETRESARGLIVNMSDVLFDTGSYNLKPGAREKLAKVSGILIAHPGLRIEVEGHTDNVGGSDYNQRLSENRAMTVRDYLTGQGVPQASVSARGFGETMPVASNDSPSGRQQNRRVELVVSGEAIGSTAPSQ